MCFLHAASAVLTRTARGFADLIDEHLPQARKVCPRELQVYSVISGHPVPEVFDDRRDGVDATKSLKQTPFHRSSSVQPCSWSSVPPTGLTRHLDYWPISPRCQEPHRTSTEVVCEAISVRWRGRREAARLQVRISSSSSSSG